VRRFPPPIPHPLGTRIDPALIVANGRKLRGLAAELAWKRRRRSSRVCHDGFPHRHECLPGRSLPCAVPPRGLSRAVDPTQLVQFVVVDSILKSKRTSDQDDVGISSRGGGGVGGSGDADERGPLFLADDDDQEADRDVRTHRDNPRPMSIAKVEEVGLDKASIRGRNAPIGEPGDGYGEEGGRGSARTARRAATHAYPPVVAKDGNALRRQAGAAATDSLSIPPPSPTVGGRGGAGHSEWLNEEKGDGITDVGLRLA
jgi:hypothetical protein